MVARAAISFMTLGMFQVQAPEEEVMVKAVFVYEEEVLKEIGTPTLIVPVELEKVMFGFKAVRVSTPELLMVVVPFASVEALI